GLDPRNLRRDARHKTGFDRKLGGGERQRFLGELDGEAIDLEQDAAGLDAADPELDRALARAHADFERLLRHRNVRIDADPNLAGALHVPGERAARGLDLARGDALRLRRLEPVLTEGQVLGARGNAADAT